MMLVHVAPLAIKARPPPLPPALQEKGCEVLIALVLMIDLSVVLLDKISCSDLRFPGITECSAVVNSCQTLSLDCKPELSWQTIFTSDKAKE